MPSDAAADDMPDSALDAAPDARARRARRSFGWRSLAMRILLVNLLALAALAGGLIHLESFRTRLIDTRQQELVRQGELLAGVLADADRAGSARAVRTISTARGTRVRLVARDGQLLADNWTSPAVHRFVLADPARAGFRRESAILIDRMVNFVIGKGRLPPLPADPAGTLPPYPEVREAALGSVTRSVARHSPDQLIVLQAAVPLPDGAPPHRVLLLTADASDIIDLVRRERQGAFFVFLGVLAASLALSFFLARTIVLPLRQLAFAAHRVRLGRARDVMVPRLPHRRDEIGALARALADMTAALRQRIDATEAFAADVVHELKNPLASIRSAVEALSRVRDDDARAKLFALLENDVGRIDRLIVDISEASRLDAELSRTRLRPVDAGDLVQRLADAINSTAALPNTVTVRPETAPGRPLLIAADPDRLAQVLNNLVDNAASFSPPGGTVTLGAGRVRQLVEIFVEDEGPGVPPDNRDGIFRRFYSERPGNEDYGRHSGLGLSIASAIVRDMGGDIRVGDRRDGKRGARFVVAVPALSG